MEGGLQELRDAGRGVRSKPGVGRKGYFGCDGGRVMAEEL